MIITLTGYMGSGKSFIGKQLADRLSLPFFDLDSFIEEKEQQSIATIFKDKGQIYFRKREHETLLDVLKNQDNIILSLGGGTPCFYDNMDHINQNSVCFYLKSNITTLSKRLQKEKEQRPLIAHLQEGQLPEFIAKHLFERRPFYEKARYIIDTEQQSLEEILNFMKTIYEEKNH